MAHNLKSIKEQFKAKGVFYTPKELAETLRSYLPKNIEEVYDPTCGCGDLLSIFDDDVRKYGQEIDAEQAKEANLNLVNADIRVGDTLASPMFPLDKRFEYIIANPPFSIKWNPPVDKDTDVRFINVPTIPSQSKADYAFILHILHHLSNTGLAVILNFPGILYRGGREGIIRQWLIEQNYIDKIIYIDGDTFVDTKISTVIFVLSKHKENTNIALERKRDGKTKVITLKEIKEADFTLSDSRYFIEEEKKEKIDPLQLNNKAHQEMLLRLKADLSMEVQICKIEGWSMNKYLDDLLEVVNSFRGDDIPPSLFE